MGEEATKKPQSTASSPAQVKGIERNLFLRSPLCGEMEIPAYLCVSDKRPLPGESAPNRTRSIMSQSNERELQLLRKHFLSLVSEESPIITRPVTDLFLLADCATGTLHLYDDEDQEISHVPVFAWAETGAEGEPSSLAIETLRELVTRLEQKGFWDRPCFARPFSVELIRPDFTVIEDLLFLDEDLIKIEPPLLDGVGEELDRFLDELLEDLK